MVETIKRSEDQEKLYCTAVALAGTKDSRAVDLLVDSLEDEDLLVASRAATALGIMQDRRAVGPLLYALTELNIPCPAASALGWIRDESSLQPLIEALHHKKSGKDQRKSGEDKSNLP